MIDLTTSYLGLELRSPVVASASPMTRNVDAARTIESAGAGAIVLPSLFEEEIVHEEVELHLVLQQGVEQFAEALDYFPEVPAFESVLDTYLANLAEMKRALDIPVIASLNATSSGEWIRYAQLLCDAGADAVELNVYRLAADPTGSAAEVEAGDIDLVAAVAAAVDRPVAVKLAPYYTAMANFAQRVAGAGAKGLVLFNRFYQPDIDLEALDVVPRIDLSAPWELRLPLRWIAILRPVLGPDVSLAATSGIHSGADLLKALMVGADVGMMTSALLHHGPDHVATVLAEMQAWMVDHEYVAVRQLQGSMSYTASDRPGAFERANYIRSLHSLTTPSEFVPAAPMGYSGVVQPDPD